MKDSPLLIPDRVDAVVCGGGPAGSTFAALLSRKGYRVVLFERERFPRFHIGESLLPWNVPLLQRIGVLDGLQRNGAQVKLGARFYHQGTDRVRPVRFVNGLDANYPSAFQVKRADFDKMLLDNARDAGARCSKSRGSRKYFSARMASERAASACAWPANRHRARYLQRL
jgi:2-polyprenyl-6-methoxyphenol hydroxylase-like FAD-dependent oxidoreductase